MRLRRRVLDSNACLALFKGKLAKPACLDENFLSFNWLAAAGESMRMEFKTSTVERGRACRTLRAFANGLGIILTSSRHQF